MRYLKIFEYYKNWMHHSSKERYKLERYLDDILYEIKDSEYKYMISGWVSKRPYVWIKAPISEIYQISDIIKSITSYLESEGFETKIEKLSIISNKPNLIDEQIWIYFNKLV